MPEEIWRGLSDEHRSEIIPILVSPEVSDRLFSAIMENHREPFEPLKLGELARNPGLCYLWMSTPNKYSVIEYFRDEELLGKLFEWDFSHVDTFSACFRSGPDSTRLLEQAFSSYCALLQNNFVTVEFLEEQTALLEAMWRREYPEVNFAEMLDYTIWDKWSPDGYSAGTLSILPGIFERWSKPELTAGYTPEAIASYYEDDWDEDED